MKGRAGPRANRRAGLRVALDLLETDNIRVGTRDHTSNALHVVDAVHSDAAMHVVCHQPQRSPRRLLFKHIHGRLSLGGRGVRWVLASKIPGKPRYRACKHAEAQNITAPPSLRGCWGGGRSPCVALRLPSLHPTVAPRRERYSWCHKEWSTLQSPSLDIKAAVRNAPVLGGGALPGTGGGLSSCPEPNSRAICASAQRARHRIGCEGAAALAPTVCVCVIAHVTM